MSNDTVTPDPTIRTRTYTATDSYGRSVRHYDVNGRTVVVVVTLPRRTATPGRTHLTNDWAGSRSGVVAPGEAHAYHGSLAQARAAALAIVAREVGAARQRAEADDVWQEGPAGN